MRVGQQITLNASLVGGNLTWDIDVVNEAQTIAPSAAPASNVSSLTNSTGEPEKNVTANLNATRAPTLAPSMTEAPKTRVLQILLPKMRQIHL